MVSIIIYCIVIIKFRLCKNTSWYSVGIAVPGMLLFLFGIIEIMIYVDHNADYYAIKKFENSVRNLQEDEVLAKAPLVFAMSKYEKYKGFEIGETEKLRELLNMPDLEPEVKKLLTDFVEAKDKKDGLIKKSTKMKDRMRYRTTHPWVLVLPNKPLYD